MGKSKKNLDDLKKDLDKSKDIKPIKKDDQSKVVGGKKNEKWNSGCGGIVPQ